MMLPGVMVGAAPSTLPLILSTLCDKSAVNEPDEVLDQIDHALRSLGLLRSSMSAEQVDRWTVDTPDRLLHVLAPPDARKALCLAGHLGAFLRPRK